MNRTYKYFDKQNLKTSFDIGEITPVYWNTIYPGESIKNFRFEVLTRMINPFYPLLDSSRISLFAFAVPKRILILEGKNSKKVKNVYISHKKSSDNAFNYIFKDYSLEPDFSGVSSSSVIEFLNSAKKVISSSDIINPSSLVHNSNLLAKFGINYKDLIASGKYPFFKFNIIYLLAYWKIYEQFFKQKQLEKFDYSNFYRHLTDEGNDLSIELPLTVLNSSEVDKITLKNSTIFNNSIKKFARLSAALPILNKVALVNSENDLLDSLTYSPLSFSTGGDWNEFKKVLHQDYVKNSLNISKLDEGTLRDNLISVWNISNGSKTNPSLLGYYSYNQGIDQVINQAQSTGNVLGEVGGLSVTYNYANLFKDFTAEEETIIMVLAVPTYKMNISGSFELAEWNAENEFNPQTDYIQEKTFLGSISKFGDNNKVIGYNYPFDFLRNKKDVIAGDIMDKWSNWTFVYKPKDDFDGIDLNVLKINKTPFKETLVSPNQDSFIAEFNFIYETNRTIKPKNLIDEQIKSGD